MSKERERIIAHRDKKTGTPFKAKNAQLHSTTLKNLAEMRMSKFPSEKGTYIESTYWGTDIEFTYGKRH